MREAWWGGVRKGRHPALWATLGRTPPRRAAPCSAAGSGGGSPVAQHCFPHLPSPLHLQGICPLSGSFSSTQGMLSLGPSEPAVGTAGADQLHGTGTESLNGPPGSSERRCPPLDLSGQRSPAQNKKAIQGLDTRL